MWREEGTKSQAEEGRTNNGGEGKEIKSDTKGEKEEEEE